ncbi:MAG TPA: HAD family acid phosphatase [Thermoanaerobaculia bacterium]|nr:HAD family acid phosphatase [Thermoanaerobaculia bacterium]
MRQPIVISLALLAVSCATQQTAPTPAATTTPAATSPASAAAPCNPGLAIVNATLWMQSAAEYQAAAIGTYAAARRALDAALADPAWHVEEGTSDPSQPPAVILDADETVIDNTAFEVRVIREGKTYDAATWQRWVNESAAEAVPGAAQFLAYAKSRGVTPFYITNRDHPDEAAGTLRNLQRLGFPVDANGDTLLLRGERPEWKTSDKAPRRAHVAASHRVLLLVGDDLNDFTNARDKSVAERDQLVGNRESWWGTRWFMIPNPVYGSWERPYTSGVSDPCAQLQRKLEALRP